MPGRSSRWSVFAGRKLSHYLSLTSMQQGQRSQPPRCIHFTPPFAHVHLPNPGSWLHHHKPSTSAKDMLAVNFSGTWIKDKAASESMSEAISLMGLSGLMRQAIKLIKGVNISQDEDSFSMAVFSVLTWFKVSERYTLDGTVSNCRRRDFRRGGHRGHVTAAAADKMLLHLQWDDPYGGEGLDAFSMPSPDVLHIDSTITVNGKTCKYRTVYNRKD